MSKNLEEEQKTQKKEVKEHFSDPDVGAAGEIKGIETPSLTKLGFCAGLGSEDEAVQGSVGGRKKRGISFMPNRDQMAGEFSKYNPIWLTFPVLNLLIQILKMVYGVWLWLFELVFFKTYEILVPEDLDFGFKSGKKYCFNLMTFRMLVTFLCPPAGVFMEYGLTGFVQILICAVLSLFFYVPGLIYGIIVILRSDVAEYIEQVELNVCGDDGSTSMFSSGGEENEAKCNSKVGDICTVKGEAGGDPLKLNCCMQPKFRNGRWYWGDSDEIAQGPDGTEIRQFAEGELKCKDDFNTKLAEKNICVYKSTGGVGMVGFG